MDRRTFLRAAAGGAASCFLPENSQILRAMPQAQSLFGKVKVRDVQTTSINIKYPAHLVRVVTDQGVIGIGEAYNRAGILDLIHDMKRMVIGEDPLQVDYLFQKMIEAGIGHGSQTGQQTGAIAGIESALWDAAGKILNVPIYVLLGGKFRDRLLIYHDTGSPPTPDPGPWVAEAEASLNYGFKAMKFDVDWESRGQALAGKKHQYRGEIWNRGIAPIEMEQWVKILTAIRKRIGDKYPLGVDLHFNYNVPDSIRFIHMVEDLNLWFVEDPTPPLNADAIKKITDAVRTPICTGENLFTRETWRPFIEKQACDCIQPDPQKVGGLLETKKLADWADLAYMPMFCHNMCTPVGTIGSAHACASIRSFVALESDSVELPYWQDIVKHDGPLYKDGYFELPNRPGLGFDLDEAVCKKHLSDGARWWS